MPVDGSMKAETKNSNVFVHDSEQTKSIVRKKTGCVFVVSPSHLNGEHALCFICRSRALFGRCLLQCVWPVKPDDAGVGSDVGEDDNQINALSGWTVL